MEAREAIKRKPELERTGDRAKETRALAAPRVRGKTFISDDVVSVIAHRAAEAIEGIHKIGDSNLRSWISRLGRHHGVAAEVGMSEAAVDLEVVMEFGYPIREVAQDLREAVIETVETMTGRSVVEVNVHVVDIYMDKPEQHRRRQLE